MERLSVIIILLPLLLASCVKHSQPFTDTPIIESYLSPGSHPVVKIYRQIPFEPDVTYSSDDVNNLAVSLRYGDKNLTLLPIGDSLYSDTSNVIEDATKYTLSFRFNSKDVTAYTTVPSKPEEFTESVNVIAVQKLDSTSFPSQGSEPDPVVLSWKNTDTTYYIVVVENIETVLNPVRDFGTGTAPPNMFRERPTTASGLELRAQEFRYFGKHRIILFHVQPDYASLYENNGVTSSQNLTNPSTSITNGYGIFTGLNADTLYLQVNQNILK
ncbi:MAG TPA: hypothetical protein VMT63_00185 [Bacteroidales bacterium]|nr:hypothetical protein [Bacteroidales bacterium]